MPAENRRPRGRRTTVISATVGAAVVAVCAVLLIPGASTQKAADTPTATSTIDDGSSVPASGPAIAATTSATATASASVSASASASPSGSAIPSIPTAALAGPPKLSISASQTVPGTLQPTWPNQGQAEITLESGAVTRSYGPIDSAQPIASITKTMTAYLILHDHPLSPGQQGPTITLTAADVAAYKYDVNENMSSVPVTAGEQLTENQALEALMLPSADNIADVLAHWDTGTSTDDAFVSKMNTEAACAGRELAVWVDLRLQGRHDRRSCLSRSCIGC